MKETTVRARVDGALKNDAEEIFKELGLTTSLAITLFLKQVVLRRGLPFAVEIPEEEDAP